MSRKIIGVTVGTTISPQRIAEKFGGGKDGKDGYTPVKGVDYFTEEDVKYIVSRVLAELNKPKKGEKLFTLCGTDPDNGTGYLLNEVTFEAGKGYFFNDTYFVAKENEYYVVAPPLGLKVTASDGNIGEVWDYNGSWGFSWEHAPDNSYIDVYAAVSNNTGDNGGGDVDTVADVEASVDENGVLTMNTNLDWIRWYDVTIWKETKENAPCCEYESDYLQENTSMSIALKELFEQSYVPLPDSGTKLIIRVEADDETNDPTVEIETVWRSAWGDAGETYTKGELIDSLTENELSNGTTSPFLEEGKGYFVEDVYFVAVKQGSYIAPPEGTVIDNGRNSGAVSLEGSNWRVPWENGPDDTPVNFYKVVGETYTPKPVKGEPLYTTNYIVNDGGIDFYSKYPLELGKKYFIEDTLFTAENSTNGFPAPPVGTAFYFDWEDWFILGCSGGCMSITRKGVTDPWQNDVNGIRIYKVEGETYAGHDNGGSNE